MGRIAQLKEATRAFFDEEVTQRVRDDAAMRIRSDPRIQKRWMGYTGAEDPSGIDYSDPCVMIEFMAADPQILGLAEDADRFVACTGCDREIFLRHYWPGGGNPDAQFPTADGLSKDYRRAARRAGLHRKKR